MISLQKEFELIEVYDSIRRDNETSLPPNECQLRCIGFQSDIVLVAFNTETSSKIGYFCLTNRTVTTLYSHPEQIDILVASLNEDRNLLVYAKRKHATSSTYQSYLVELTTLRNITLNIESPQTQHLKFFPWRNAKEIGNRKEHLVFFIEKRQLGVVHIITTLSKDDNLEVQQIQKEYLVQHYVWYQLDLPAMRLYYIFLHQRVSEGEVKTSSSMFNVFQFSTRSNPEKALSVSLPLPLYPSLYPPSKRYMIGPVSSRIPDSNVNITVLRPSSTGSESLVLGIAYHSQYYVYLIHSGYLIECKYGEVDTVSRGLVFLQLAGFVIVYSPPHVLHCIDVSAEHATRNNMVYDKCPVPPDIDATNDEEICQAAGREMPLCDVVLKSGEPGIFVNQSSLYKVYLDETAILQDYRSTNCLFTWSFNIHLAISHLKNIKLGRTMLLHSLSKYPKTDLTDLIRDFLLISTYHTFSNQEGITHDILNAIPFPEDDSPFVVLDRNRILKISNVFQTITKPSLASQIKIQNIVSQAGPFIRFNLEDFVSKCGHMIRTATSTASSGHGSTVLTNSSDETSSVTSRHEAEEDELSDTLTNALEFHLRRRYNETVPLGQCQDAARAYFANLSQQCRVAVSLILLSAGKTPDWYPDSAELLCDENDSSLPSLHKLLGVLKYVLVRLGCPLPANFEWLHVLTGYRTYSPELFLRLLASKSIKISPSTVRRFLVTLPPEAHNRALCSAIISSLTRHQALHALKSWDSPVYRRFTSQNYLLALRNKVGYHGPAEPTNETPSYLRCHSFIPVNSFYSYLYHKVQAPDMSRKLQVLSEMSMEDTRARVSDSTLQGITFY